MSLRIHSSIGLMVGITSVSAGALAQEFEAPVSYALAAPAVLWTPADFDGDGDVDLAIVTNDGAIATAVNDGHGVFAVEASGSGVPIGAIATGAQALRAGDLNGDGAPDLLVTSSRVGSSDAEQCVVTLFLNLGDGTFGAGTRFSVTPDGANTAIAGCTGLDIGDYDADGKLDFVLAYDSILLGSTASLSGHLDVFQPQADGTFAKQSDTVLAPYAGLALASADFDGDSALELAVGEAVIYRSGAQSPRVELFSGDAAGALFSTYTAPMTNVSGLFTTARALDVTKDQRPDLFLLETPTSSSPFALSDLPLLLLPNAGDGTFGTPVTVGHDRSLVSFENGDFDGDGNSDVLLVSAEDRVTLAHGDGQGGYVASRLFTAGGGALASAAADFDADGRIDLAVLDATEPTFRVALAEPTPGDLPLPRVSGMHVHGDLVYLAPADFNGDGNIDFLASEQSAFDMLLGTGDGRFTFGAHISNNKSPARLLVGDLNGDGLLDLALPAPDDGFQTLLGSADGTFGGVTSVDLGSSAQFPEGALGDFDEDGDLDVATFRTLTTPSPGARVEGSIRFYTNDGAGHFSLDSELPVTTVVSRLVFADLNGDSHLDLFVGSSDVSILTSTSGLVPGDSLTLLGDGTGDFTVETAIATSSRNFEFGDFNVDGQLDLATNTSVALGQGDGTFGALMPFAPWTNGVAVHDMNDDGVPDLVMAAESMTGIALGHGDGTFEPVTALWQGSSENVTLAVGALDLTGDGAVDLFTARVPSSSLNSSLDGELVTLLGRVPEPPPAACEPRHRPRPFHERRPRPHRADWSHFGPHRPVR